MRLLFFIGLFFISASGLAQRFPFEFWHEGKLILEEDDTLRDNIKYDLQSDLIQFEKDNRLESYTARKIVFFEIFDKTAKRYRQFYSLPYSAQGGYRAPVFFELLAEGKLTLLCREAVEVKSYPSSFYYYGSSNRMVLVYKYFFLTDKGVIEQFSGKKNDLIYLMGNQGDQVEKYMKTNKLNLDNKYHFAQVVDYYNSFFKKE